MDEADSEIETKLCEVLGVRFGKIVASDGTWAKEVLGITSNKT
jgi:transcription initiation factor TFIID subunit 6